MRIWGDVFKPLCDRLGALLLLIPALPVMGVVALLIRWKLGSPVLFRQERPGLHGRIFTIYKFRTMSNERNENGELLPDEQRLKGVGKALRSLSLDELPQLLNVAKGEMSFIGPRPLLPEYLELYSPEQARRHEVRPGITGWAQVNGRNALNWPQRLALDVWYVDHLSFGVDLKILFLTVWKVFKKEGVSAEGHVTMEKFRGER